MDALTVTAARYKVGTNKGRPRIWIDGKRLANAGFTGGTGYLCYVERGRIVLSLWPIDRLETMIGSRTRKVTGRPDGKPIIDMLGRDVETAFPGVATVFVMFEPGLIDIVAAP
jgi:DNA (cytosine-5)-methyltransferase 1